MAIQHGRKKVPPKKSHSPQQQQQDAGQQQQMPFMQAPNVPDVDAPGMMLGHDQVPGAGFAPH